MSNGDKAVFPQPTNEMAATWGVGITQAEAAARIMGHLCGAAFASALVTSETVDWAPLAKAAAGDAADALLAELNRKAGASAYVCLSCCQKTVHQGTGRCVVCGGRKGAGE